jgi:nicotinamide-nucleotide amidase
MPSITVEKCVATLTKADIKLAFAESATAGRIASEISLVKESGSILMGSIVCYNPIVKIDLLKVPQQLIDQHSAESAEVTKAMADGLKNVIESDVQIAITGLASPGGSESNNKPVGTMFIHIKTPTDEISHREVFEGYPEEVVLQAVDRTCELLMKCTNTLIEP